MENYDDNFSQIFSKHQENFSEKLDVINEIKQHLLTSRREKNNQILRLRKQKLSKSITNALNNFQFYENNNIENSDITFERISNDSDPVSVIFLIHNFLKNSNNNLDEIFKKKNEYELKKIFKIHIKYLKKPNFGANKEKEITLYLTMISNLLNLLKEPEENILYDELDYDFFCNFAKFFWYFIENKEKNILIYIYILLLLNLLVVLHPDPDIIKCTFNLEEIIKILYRDFLREKCLKNFFGNNVKTKSINNKDVFAINDRYELFEIIFNVLIRNCCIYLELHDGHANNLVEYLVNMASFNLINNYYNVFLYELKSIVTVNRDRGYYLLFDNKLYNQFIKVTITNINTELDDNNLIRLKLILQLYLGKLIIIYKKRKENCFEQIKIFIDKKILDNLRIIIYNFYYKYKIENAEITDDNLKIAIKIFKIYIELIKIIYALIEIYYDNTISSLANNEQITIKNIIFNHLFNDIFCTNTNFKCYDILYEIFRIFVDKIGKYNNKICVFILNIFIKLFKLKKNNINGGEIELDLVKNKIRLISDPINIHMKLGKFLDCEKYEFLEEDILKFIEGCLHFTLVSDPSNQKNYLKKLKNDFKSSGVLGNEINDSTNEKMRTYAEYIIEQYLGNTHENSEIPF